MVAMETESLESDRFAALGTRSYDRCRDSVIAQEAVMPAGAKVSQLIPPSTSRCRLVLSAALIAESRAQRGRSKTLRLVSACIAHEVNQPLSGIMTNASTCLRMLNTDPPNIEGARDTALRTLRDVNRATEVISRLRTLFTKSEGAEPLVRNETAAESLELNRLVLDAVGLSQSDLYAGGVTVKFDLEDSLPHVTGDRIQLQQVLLNLIRNASEAMSAVHDRARTLTIATRREGNEHMRISVQDVGVGFADEEVDKLFRPFYTTKVHGMGIGLCVSRSIIEHHRGRLWGMANTDGPGATFCLVIPCTPRKVSQQRSVDASSRAAEPCALDVGGGL